MVETMRKCADKMDEATRKARSEELNQLIRVAALQFDPQGRVSVLAKKAGLTKQGVLHAINRGYFTAGAACALEIAAGREYLPKEKLAPHKYAAQ